ncbi:MAG TPA: Maf family protein, partial [Planctomycetota bacterium]|nr:Maf family protein [Planctomycetota bacterium]
GIAFALVEPGPEPLASGAPEELARQRAHSKAVRALLPAGAVAPVLGVDTVVDVDGRELGKPKDRAEASAMLLQLLSRSHRVHTAHVLVAPGSGRIVEELATAEVAGRAASAGELAGYLDSGDWRGKAGAYGLQDRTQQFLRLQSGAFDTVVGLHVAAVRRLLARLGSG